MLPSVRCYILAHKHCDCDCLQTRALFDLFCGLHYSVSACFRFLHCLVDTMRFRSRLSGTPLVRPSLRDDVHCRNVSSARSKSSPRFFPCSAVLRLSERRLSSTYMYDRSAAWHPSSPYSACPFKVLNRTDHFLAHLLFKDTSSSMDHAVRSQRSD